MKKRFQKRSSTKPEERNASEAVQALAHAFHHRIAGEMEQLSQIALRAADLKAEDGWRFDLNRAVYVRTGTVTPVPPA